MKLGGLSRLLVFMVSLMTAWGTEESSRREELELVRRQMALLRRLYERNPELVRQFLASPRRLYGLRQLPTSPEFNPYGEQWWELLNDDPSFSPDDLRKSKWGSKVSFWGLLDMKSFGVVSNPDPMTGI